MMLSPITRREDGVDRVLAQSLVDRQNEPPMQSGFIW